MKFHLLVCCFLTCNVTAQAAERSIAIPSGYSLIGSFLDRGNNTLPEVMPAVPEGFIVFKYDNAKGYASSQYRFGAWSDPSMTFSPGEGAWVFNPGLPFDARFTGTDSATSSTSTLYQGWNLLSLPKGASLPSPAEGDRIYQFNPQTANLKESFYMDDDWIGEIRPIQEGEVLFYLPSPANASAGDNPEGTATRMPSIFFGNYLPGILDFKVVNSLGCPLAGNEYKADLVEMLPNGETVPGGRSLPLLMEPAGYIGGANQVVYLETEPNQTTAELRIEIHAGDEAAAFTATSTVTLNGIAPSPPTILPYFRFIQVLTQLEIYKGPASQTVYQGSHLSLEGFVNYPYGKVATSQWQKENLNGEWVDIAGATFTEFVLPEANPIDSGRYRLRVSYECMVATSEPATVIVHPSESLARIVQQPISQTVAHGSKVEFRVEQNGDAVSYQWRRDGENLPNQTGISLIIPSVDNEDVGKYDVLISYPGTSLASAKARLAIFDLNVFQGHGFSTTLFIQGPVGSRYRIENTTALNAEPWQAITNIVLSSRIEEWSDPGSVAVQKRFFRAVPIQ
ncbi:MAG: hypothetical protein ACO1QB_02960 [Verrucomicrobiales bacterium]